MLKGLRFASKLASHFSHERNMTVLHLGNKLVFDVPLYYESGFVVKEVRVESGRMIINAVKRLDAELKEEEKLA